MVRRDAHSELRGDESWLFDLARRHKMLDGAYCPSGPWMVAYWTPHVLRARHKLNEKARACLFMAAGFAAHRLEKLIDTEKLNGRVPNLTAPQKTVLRLLAQGYTQDEIAKRLKRGKGTVRDHLEAARRKLGARELASCRPDRARAVSDRRSLAWVRDCIEAVGLALSLRPLAQLAQVQEGGLGSMTSLGSRAPK